MTRVYVIAALPVILSGFPQLGAGASWAGGAPAAFEPSLTTPNDSYFPELWALSNPGQANTAGLGRERRAGYDFANDDTNPMDENMNGTHVAGTMAHAATTASALPSCSTRGVREHSGRWSTGSSTPEQERQAAVFLELRPTDGRPRRAGVNAQHGFKQRLHVSLPHLDGCAPRRVGLPGPRTRTESLRRPNSRAPSLRGQREALLRSATWG
jgi:hypothetical protein